jgi:hypothetical protein
MRTIAVFFKDTLVGSPRQCTDFVGPRREELLASIWTSGLTECHLWVIAEVTACDLHVRYRAVITYSVNTCRASKNVGADIANDRGLLFRQADSACIDPNLVAFNSCGIDPQSSARPAGRNIAVKKVERCKMARTEQPAVGDPAQA